MASPLDPVPVYAGRRRRTSRDARRNPRARPWFRPGKTRAGGGRDGVRHAERRSITRVLWRSIYCNHYIIRKASTGSQHLLTRAPASRAAACPPGQRPVRQDFRSDLPKGEGWNATMRAWRQGRGHRAAGAGQTSRGAAGRGPRGSTASSRGSEPGSVARRAEAQGSAEDASRNRFVRWRGAGSPARGCVGGGGGDDREDRQVLRAGPPARGRRQTRGVEAGKGRRGRLSRGGQRLRDGAARPPRSPRAPTPTDGPPTAGTTPPARPETRPAPRSGTRASRPAPPRAPIPPRIPTPSAASPPNATLGAKPLPRILREGGLAVSTRVHRQGSLVVRFFGQAEQFRGRAPCYVRGPENGRAALRRAAARGWLASA